MVERLQAAARWAPKLIELASSGIKPDAIKRLSKVAAVTAENRRSARAVAELFFGVSMEVDLREAVSRRIYLSGSFEQPLSLFLYRYLKPGMTFLDVGAHFGYFSILAASRVGEEGRVVAMEPTPETFTILSRNLSGFPFAEPYQAGAWKTSGTLQLNDFGPAFSAFNSVAGIRLGPQAGVARKQLIEVPVWSLDEFSAAHDIHPDVVKIDVESAEREVLQGMDGVLRGARPIVSVEVGDFQHLIKQGVAPSRVFLNHLKSRNYILFEPKMEGLRRHILKTTPDAYTYDNILGVPAEKVPSLIELRADQPALQPVQ
ncbi:MAG: FkbM family methyltransferase [Propylenella sp.]